LPSDQQLNVDVNFFRGASELFKKYSIPSSWFVRIGIEVPTIVKYEEIAVKPHNDPKKYYRKTISVGSPDEIHNDDNMIVDQATGLRVVASEFHIPFLSGQILPWGDKIKSVVEEAIKLRKSDEKGIEIGKTTSNKRNARDRLAIAKEPDETGKVSEASDESMIDAVGPAVDNKKTNSDTSGTN